MANVGQQKLARLRHLWPGTVYTFALLMFASGVAYLSDHSTLGALALPVAALVALPIVLVSRWPLAAFGLVVGLGALAPTAFPTGEGVLWPPHLIIVGMVVLFVVASRYRARVVFWVWALTVATAILGRATSNSLYTDDPVPVLFFTTSALVVGYLVGARQRAQRQVVEGERRLEEVETRRAVLEERARIARELHDVVAHHMSMIAVQAETAPFRIPDMPETSKECLAEISSTARGALVEMRRLLRVLRSEDTEAERAPQPGLDQIDGLVAAARRAGVTVELAVSGVPRPLPAGADLSAYRIVQEALSNAIRHSPGADVRVETRYEPGGVRILVANGAPAGGGSAAPPGPWGHGLVGMRERVTMLGGALAAGATPDGGYLVDVSLPFDGEVS